MEVPIRVYYHVTLINDFDYITDRIFSEIIKSGLYEHIESIDIGVLGDANELPRLHEVIKKYPKAKIREHHENKGRYEFHTMKFFKQDADILPKFYGVYLHSKSVTYKTGGDEKDINNKKYEMFWSDYMLWAVVERWKDNYRALNMPMSGYDTAGCRMINKRYSASHKIHASGTFAWANSEYVKTLDNIKEDDYGKVFEPEMYLFTGEPLTYISCNAFVDGFPYWGGTFSEWMKNNSIEQYCTRS